MNRKLYVGNIPTYFTDKNLTEMFAAFGVVEFATVVKDDLSGKSRGFGLVEMTEESSAADAIKWLNYSSHDGHVVAVSVFTDRKLAH